MIFFISFKLAVHAECQLTTATRWLMTAGVKAPADCKSHLRVIRLSGVLEISPKWSVAVQPAICSREDSQNKTIDVVGSNGVDTNRNMYLLILSMCQVMRIECGNGGN